MLCIPAMKGLTQLYACKYKHYIISVTKITFFLVGIYVKILISYSSYGLVDKTSHCLKRPPTFYQLFLNIWQLFANMHFALSIPAELRTESH